MRALGMGVPGVTGSLIGSDRFHLEGAGSLHQKETKNDTIIRQSNLTQYQHVNAPKIPSDTKLLRK